MASSPSNKPSSSPIFSRMNPGPVFRNSETGNPVRKSFAGNPFAKPSIIASSRGLNPKTPANSPLDYQRRSSTGSRDSDEKENGKDHNPKHAKVRSPTIPNGEKNFMSPTISASFKIAMSPKKKILAEKNDPVRTSLSLSDLKSSSINSVNPHEASQPTSLNQKPTDSNNDFSSADAASDLMDLLPALRAPSSIPKLSKTVTFIDCVTKNSGSLSNFTSENADAVDLADRFKISPTPPYPSPSSFPTLAPLDADPSMPPYDSKTNYLSPRPQFLLYRPNPRIERYLHKEEGGKSLEGSFLSESFSDTDVTEETQSESFENSDEVSSDEFAEKVKQEKDDEEEEEKQSPSEPSRLVGKDTIDENSEDKGNSKPFNLYKLTALILLLCFCGSSVLYTTPLVKNNYPSEAANQFSKLSYPELANKFWVLSKNVVAYAHGVILNLGEEHGVIHPVQYFNMTALREEISADGYFVFDRSHGRIDGFLSEPTREIVVESESLEEENELLQKHVELEEEAEEDYSEIMEDPEPSFEQQEHHESELHEGLEGLSGEKGAAESEAVEMNNSLEVKDAKLPLKPVRAEEAGESFELPVEELSGENGAVEMNHNSEIKDEKLPLKPVGVEEAEEENFELPVEELSGENGAVEMNHNLKPVGVEEAEEESSELYPLKPVGVEEAEEESSELDVKLNDDALESFESSAMAALSNVNPLSSEATIKQVISVILLMPLMAAAVYFYSRRVKTISSNAKESKAKYLSSSKDDNRPLSRNFLTDGDMVEESCPSELSSFQKSSSYGKKGARGAGSNKAQSQETLRKNCRRESVSSSLDYSVSTDSPSYGSFTAYKKFSAKHSNCEEEVVTPVRRSSRIKTKFNVGDD